jgi:prefoldin subunit 5
MSTSELEVLQAQIDALDARVLVMETRLAERDAREQQLHDDAAAAAAAQAAAQRT